jgi:hypothetical protein
VRAAELKKWAEGRDHQRIMEGHYLRRDGDQDASVSDSFREHANHYADTMRTSRDPLIGLMRDIAGGAGDLGGRLRDAFTGRQTDRPAGGERPGDGEHPGGDDNDRPGSTGSAER